MTLQSHYVYTLGDDITSEQVVYGTSIVLVEWPSYRLDLCHTQLTTMTNPLTEP